MNLSGPGVFLVGRLLIFASISDFIMVYSKIQLFPGLGLGGHRSPGIYPFLPGLLVYVHRVVCNIL